MYNQNIKQCAYAISADPTDDKLSIRITRTGGDEITIASPTSKKNRQCTLLQPLEKETNVTIDDEMIVDINTLFCSFVQ
jgi:hypothetical protein